MPAAVVAAGPVLLVRPLGGARWPAALSPCDGLASMAWGFTSCSGGVAARRRSTHPVYGQDRAVASYSVNKDGMAWAQQLIDNGQYVLDSDWGKVQPRAGEQNAFLKSHSWEEYSRWHLGFTDGAKVHTRAR